MFELKAGSLLCFDHKELSIVLKESIKRPSNYRFLD